MEINPKMEASWLEVLNDELDKNYYKDILKVIHDDIENWITIYPEVKNIFKAFDKTPFKDVKVVILGQDPYHWEWQAQGFCFSVPEWMKLPPSLRNMYKELNASLWIEPSTSWDLTPWTEQGVFLLNAILTVQAGSPASHAKIWWEKFTDHVIKTISDNKKWVIFLLWWAFAQWKKKLIDIDKHIVLETTHPSPFSAHKWFLGSNCFKQVNDILIKKWQKEIDWKI